MKIVDWDWTEIERETPLVRTYKGKQFRNKRSSKVLKSRFALPRWSSAHQRLLTIGAQEKGDVIGSQPQTRLVIGKRRCSRSTQKGLQRQEVFELTISVGGSYGGCCRVKRQPEGRLFQGVVCPIFYLKARKGWKMNGKTLISECSRVEKVACQSLQKSILLLCEYGHDSTIDGWRLHARVCWPTSASRTGFRLYIGNETVAEKITDAGAVAQLAERQTSQSSEGRTSTRWGRAGSSYRSSL